MRELNEIEVCEVDGAGFFGGLQGAFEGAVGGGGLAAAGVGLGMAVTGPIALGLVVGGAVVVGAYGYYTRAY